MAAIAQHFNATILQSAYHRSMFIKHFKRPGYSRELDAINFVTEKFTFWCENFEVHKKTNLKYESLGVWEQF